MSLSSFARLMYRRRRLVVTAWLLLLIGLHAAAGRWSGEHRADYSIPGSESAAAGRLIAERLPELSGDRIELAFNAPEGIAAPATQTRIHEIMKRIDAVPHTRSVSEPVPGPDGRIGLSSVQLDAPVEKVPVPDIAKVIRIVSETTDAKLTVEAGGMAVQNAEGTEAGSEQIGIVIALAILIVAFGSLLAAGLPIGIALFGVGAALAASKLVANILIVPDWAPQLVTMIGIGVGIDYALFVVVRYRTALKRGLHPEDAVVEAVATAGRAVLFAGGTVMISLLGLCAMGLEYLYGTAAVCMVGVAIVVSAALTLLPALLGFVGGRIDRFSVPFVRGDSGEGGVWARWSRVIQRSPAVTGMLALLVLLALASPIRSLRFGYPDGGSGSTALTSRRAYDLVERGFGPGANGPLLVAIDRHDDPTVVDAVAGTLRRTPGIAAVMAPVVNKRTDAAALIALPTTGPQDAETSRTLIRVRDAVKSAMSGRSATAHIGGATAVAYDESRFMGARLPLFIGAVIGLSFLLLLVVFRSVLVAAKAAVMNLLAIGAAYGVMATALKGGWLGGLLGISESTPIPVWAPMMMFALLFGLSMDYEVFLLSRIKEEYDRTGDNAGAVAFGLARTGRVISAAAAIMVAVFGAFILSDGVLAKVLGLGLAVSVALDATLVRMVLVPSTMELLGTRNWWMPRWLDRLLPRIDVEGHEVANAEDPKRALIAA